MYDDCRTNCTMSFGDFNFAAGPKGMWIDLRRNKPDICAALSSWVKFQYVNQFMIR